MISRTGQEIALRRLRPLRPFVAASALLGPALTLAMAPAALGTLPASTATAPSVADPCASTLRWSAVPGATAYELALVALPAGERPVASAAGEAVLHVLVAGPATAWLPPRAWCPRPGQRYAWMVRPLAGGSVTSGVVGAAGDLRPSGDWTAPRLLVASRPGEGRSARRLVAELEARLDSPQARDELRRILTPTMAASAPGPETDAEQVAPLGSAAAGRTTGLAAPASAGGPVALGPHFLGTSSAQDFELRLDGERALLLSPTAGTANLVYGASANGVVDGVVGATIAGGGGAGPDAHLVRDHYGTIGGGRGNTAGDAHVAVDVARWATVGGGTSNAASGSASTVGGGTLNVADGNFTTIAGGAQNFAAQSFASIGGGQWHDVLHLRGAVPGGSSAKARLFGQLAYAGGGFGGQLQSGDAQWSLYVLLAQTADATPTQLFLGNLAVAVNGDLVLEVGQTIAFRAHVSAMDSTGELGAAYRVEGVIENDAGATSFVGTPTVTVLGEDVAGWNLVVAADDTDDALDFIATGAAATDVRWVATVRTAEVRF